MKNGRPIVLTRKLHGQTDRRQTDRQYDYNTPLCREVKKAKVTKMFTNTKLLLLYRGQPLQIYKEKSEEVFILISLWFVNQTVITIQINNEK